MGPLGDFTYSKTSWKPLTLSSFKTASWSLAQGKADVTRVKNVLFSHFKISQQFFKLETEESLELKAD